MSNLKDFIIKSGGVAGYTGKDSIVVVPNNMPAIDRTAFAGCETMTEVVLSNRIKSR